MWGAGKQSRKRDSKKGGERRSENVKPLFMGRG